MRGEFFSLAGHEFVKYYLGAGVNTQGKPYAIFCLIPKSGDLSLPKYLISDMASMGKYFLEAEKQKQSDGPPSSPKEIRFEYAKPRGKSPFWQNLFE